MRGLAAKVAAVAVNNSASATSIVRFVLIARFRALSPIAVNPNKRESETEANAGSRVTPVRLASISRGDENFAGIGIFDFSSAGKAANVDIAGVGRIRTYHESRFVWHRNSMREICSRLLRGDAGRGSSSHWLRRFRWLRFFWFRWPEVVSFDHGVIILLRSSGGRRPLMMAWMSDGFANPSKEIE